MAQSWCPPEARWKYDMGHPWGYASEMMIYCGGDTIVDGHSAIKMMRSVATTQLMGIDTMITQTGLFHITREDQGIVLQWHPNLARWDTLFWITANPGDHWTPPLAFGFGYCDPPLTLHVLDTSTVVMNGIQLRQLEVQLFDEDFGFSWIVLIRERLGYMHSFFHLIPDCMGVFECYCQFQCYSDAQISYPGSGTCEITVDVEVVHAVPTFEIFPNPGHESFIVRNSGMVISELYLRDAMGRLLMGPVSFQDNIRVDVSELPTGTYLIELKSPSSSVMKRWVKH